jgi:amidophosphoribosyltransferase
MDIRSRLARSFVEAADEYPEKMSDGAWIKEHVHFAGELLLGHLRYGTHGASGETFCHPFLRQNNWMTRNLVLAGNFNLTNNRELFEMLVELGQHPRNHTDTVVVLEKMGHFLDEANESIFRKHRKAGMERTLITAKIIEELDLGLVLRKATRAFDGGYVMAGMLGHGDLFVLRDPAGIRPAFYYEDEEIVAVASERPQIKTALNVPLESIREVEPGHALIVRKDGSIQSELINEPLEKKPCSFERIYFSRGTDLDIYRERKLLGRSLVKQVLSAVKSDLEHTVFSYIPNTAETAFYGLMEGLRDFRTQALREAIEREAPKAEIERLLTLHPRIEKLMTKDAKLRTFITADADREELVSQVYDTTYGIIAPSDTLVVLDDSIVRGTTLRRSILRILDRLKMKKIIVVSSAPQIRYPDCYGIDMSKMGDFVAFEAAVSLVREQADGEAFLTSIYEAAVADLKKPVRESENEVKRLFASLSLEAITERIGSILTPKDLSAEVEIIFQRIEGLHRACPSHQGDWYFTGNYPTPGGNRVANRAFINFMESSNERAY